MVKYKENLGSAHIYVDLTDRVLTVKHGDDKRILFQRKAKKGTWNNIWKALQGGSK